MWVVFDNGKAGYFEIDNGVPSSEFPGYNDRAKLDSWYERNRQATASRYDKVIGDYCATHSIKVVDKWELPYPARPKLHSDYPPGKGCPPFCHDANACKGRGSCPRSRACDD